MSLNRPCSSTSNLKNQIEACVLPACSNYITATQQVGKTKDVLSALKTAAAVPKKMSLLTLFDLIFPSHDPLSYSAQT